MSWLAAKIKLLYSSNNKAFHFTFNSSFLKHDLASQVVQAYPHCCNQTAWLYFLGLLPTICQRKWKCYAAMVLIVSNCCTSVSSIKISLQETVLSTHEDERLPTNEVRVTDTGRTDHLWLEPTRRTYFAQVILFMAVSNTSWHRRWQLFDLFKKATKRLKQHQFNKHNAVTDE